MTEGRICQSVDDASDREVEEALDQLVAEERLERVDEGHTVRYRVPDTEFRLYETNWMACIDGLNNLVGNLTDAVVGRFFDGDDRSFARALNFRIKESDLEQLHAMYEEEIFETLKALEEEVDDPEADDVVDMSLSTLWAPTDLSEDGD